MSKLFPELNKEWVQTLTDCELDSVQMRISVEIAYIKATYGDTSHIARYISDSLDIEQLKKDLDIVERELADRILLEDK